MRNDQGSGCPAGTRRDSGRRGRIFAASAGAGLTAVAALVLGSATSATALPMPVVQLKYGNPVLSDDTGRVTWRWTVANSGPQAVNGVTVTHNTGKNQVNDLPDICTAGNGSVTCRIQRLESGDSVDESLEVQVSGYRGGDVGMRGEVRWPGGSSSVSRSGTPAKKPQSATPAKNSETAPAPAKGGKAAVPATKGKQAAAPAKDQGAVTPAESKPAAAPSKSKGAVTPAKS